MSTFIRSIWVTSVTAVMKGKKSRKIKGEETIIESNTNAHDSPFLKCEPFLLTHNLFINQCHFYFSCSAKVYFALFQCCWSTRQLIPKAQTHSCCWQSHTFSGDPAVTFGKLQATVTSHWATKALFDRGFLVQTFDSQPSGLKQNPTSAVAFHEWVGREDDRSLWRFAQHTESASHRSTHVSRRDRSDSEHKNTPTLSTWSRTSEQKSCIMVILAYQYSGSSLSSFDTMSMSQYQNIPTVGPCWWPLWLPQSLKLKS